MKIKCIESINNYGIFKSYSKGTTKDFFNENIIFGWNYSGKTTLSRIFRSLERKEAHKDYGNGKFKITLDNNNVLTEQDIPTNTLNIRVFNSDYVKENLSWDQPNEGIQPILIIGEKNIELEKQIITLRKDIESLLEKYKKNNEQKELKEKEFDSSLTEEARRITNELSLGRNFRRPDLETLLNNKNIVTWHLTNGDFHDNKTTALLRKKHEPIREISIELDKNLVDKTKEILLKTVTPSQIIEKLINDLRLENWVREGRFLHQGNNVCEFCGGDLPDNLFSKLDAHFSKDYESFRKYIEEYISCLGKCLITVDLKHKNDFYDGLKADYEIRRKELEKEITIYNTIIEKIADKVKNKLLYLTKPLVLDETISLNHLKLQNKLYKFNELIERHNQKTTDFDRIKSEAINKLKKHYAAEFSSRFQYDKKKKEIESITKESGRLSSLLKEKNEEIKSKEEKVSESAKGADRLNDYLRRYFGQSSSISIRVNASNRFQVIRGDVEASNLSEGEKTAISFSHFLTCMEDKDTKTVLGDTIIFIDDPVSSLDSNHLFNTYALITSFLKCKCGQLFISTHNYEFFNLLKDEFKPRDPKRCDYNKRKSHVCNAFLYQIEKTNNNAGLMNIDCLLCHFKSEYRFLFYQLYQINNYQYLDEYKLFTMPNLLRRFLEIYLEFTFPSGKGLYSKLPHLIHNDEKRKLVHKIINELSHNDNTERSLKLYTTGEIKQAVEITFEAIQNTRPDYFNELVQSIRTEELT